MRKFICEEARLLIIGVARSEEATGPYHLVPLSVDLRSREQLPRSSWGRFSEADHGCWRSARWYRYGGINVGETLVAGTPRYSIVPLATPS